MSPCSKRSRVLTLRDPFEGGMYADAGAARIHVDHAWTLRYVKEFNLDVVPFYPGRLDFLSLEGRAPVRTDWRDFAQRVYRRFWMRLGDAEEWVKIKGGNDRLASAFAAALNDKVIYRAPITKIIRSDDVVRIQFPEQGAMQELSADYAICTIALTVPTDVDVSPSFSADKQQAIQRTQYDSASRVFLAGEDTSDWPAWMQGALQAGNTAAAAVHRAS